MYLEAGSEKLFAWNTIRHMGGEAQFSDRTKRILEVFHHKPTAFGINRTSWMQLSIGSCDDADGQTITTFEETQPLNWMFASPVQLGRLP